MLSGPLLLGDRSHRPRPAELESPPGPGFHIAMQPCHPAVLPPPGLGDVQTAFPPTPEGLTVSRPDAPTKRPAAFTSHEIKTANHTCFYAKSQETGSSIRTGGRPREEGRGGVRQRKTVLLLDPAFAAVDSGSPHRRLLR